MAQCCWCKWHDWYDLRDRGLGWVFVNQGHIEAVDLEPTTLTATSIAHDSQHVVLLTQCHHFMLGNCPLTEHHGMMRGQVMMR